MAKLTYETIERYSGVGHNRIRRALSWLAVQGLVHIDRVPSDISADGMANVYRLAHLNTRRHMGTLGRNQEVWEA